LASWSWSLTSSLSSERLHVLLIDTWGPRPRILWSLKMNQVGITLCPTTCPFLKVQGTGRFEPPPLACINKN
jgi:hypothetical protein